LSGPVNSFLDLFSFIFWLWLGVSAIVSAYKPKHLPNVWDFASRENVNENHSHLAGLWISLWITCG